jgi:anaerobic selenocysteine-containing dehydrogenase
MAGSAVQDLKESFGGDGASGSLTDFDECDMILTIRHNIAETHEQVENLWVPVAQALRPWPRRVIGI